MKAVKALLSLSLSVGFCAAVHAQNERASLRGITSVGILVEGLDGDAQKCGITEDALDAAVRLPLSNSRIKVNNGNLKLEYLYVNVKVVNATNDYSRCAADISLAFTKYVQSERDHGVFWEKSSIVIGPSAYVSRSANEHLEGFTKQFVAAWLKAN